MRVAVVFRDVGKVVLSKGVRPVRLGADSAVSFQVGDNDKVGGIDAGMGAVGTIAATLLACSDTGEVKLEGD